VNIWLKLGKLIQAKAWIAENQLHCDMEINYKTELGLISLARVLIVQRKLNEAQELLVRLAASAASGGRNGRLIEVLVLHALALQAAGNVKSALETLVKALQLAEPEGYIRIFLDEGPSMIQLLKELTLSDLDSPLQNYIDRLIEVSTQIQN
jgi:LuxR family maltose regulon positive regulatory protein